MPGNPELVEKPTEEYLLSLENCSKLWVVRSLLFQGVLFSSSKVRCLECVCG